MKALSELQIEISEGKREFVLTQEQREGGDVDISVKEKNNFANLLMCVVA
jgi:hypothetical protein